LNVGGKGEGEEGHEGVAKKPTLLCCFFCDLNVEMKSWIMIDT
jgi:hypothetical protein